jgi:hypothetical protein
MAKPKTKKTVFDTTVSETGPGLNVWRWNTQGFEWELDLGRRGLNFSMVASESVRPVAFFEKLDQAVSYAWGFTYGFNERGRAETKEGCTPRT